MWPVAIAAAGVVLFLCYVRLSGTFPVGSDGASNSLEAWDMLHGNWLLHGWMLTDVSFYTTELPEYVLVELARGLNPSVVHVASAISYTLLVILAGLLAKGEARGREGWARALIAAGIMIAPQLGNAIHVLLSQPDHVGTQVPILVIFLVLDRAPRRWYTPVAIGVLMAIVVLADKVTILNAAVPLAVACALRALWAIARRRSRLAGQWFELSLIAAAAAGTAAGVLAVRVIHRLGGFALMPVESGLAARSQLPAHLWLAVQGVLNLFGADVVGSPPGAQTVFAWLHMIGLALAVAGFAWRSGGSSRLTACLSRCSSSGSSSAWAATCPASSRARCSTHARSRRSCRSARCSPAGCWPPRCCGPGSCRYSPPPPAATLPRSGTGSRSRSRPTPSRPWPAGSRRIT